MILHLIWEKSAARIRTIGYLVMRPGSLLLKSSELDYLDDSRTVAALSATRLGIVRIGNSELSYSVGLTIRTQGQSASWRRSLRRMILRYNSDGPQQSGFYLALPVDLTIGRNEFNRQTEMRIWEGTPSLAVRPLVLAGQTYASPHVFRVKDVVVNNPRSHISEVLKLMNDEYVVYVGPTLPSRKTFFPHVFIEIPVRDALDSYLKILAKVLEAVSSGPGFSKTTVLVTGGILGTMLSAKLNSLEIRTLDIGQVFRHIEEVLGV